MLHHQDQPMNSAFVGTSSSSHLQNRKCDKDSNFNFLQGKDDLGGDENRNQVRPRTLTLGRDPPGASPGLLTSPRPRLACRSHLEPLPEIESGDDGFCRVPPDGAEERMEEEGVAMTAGPGVQKPAGWRREAAAADQEQDDEWGDSGSESEYSCQSRGSASSLNMESAGEAAAGGWDRVGVGEPRLQDGEPGAEEAWRRGAGRRPPGPSRLENLREEERADQSSDSDGELLMDAVWTLRERERFKAQEMEKHQEQLTMYRRLALIRWVRTLQGRVQQQQDRLQSSFDLILTHRKELLRMGAAAMPSPAPAAGLSQS
ncbi:uncharacterized protein c19h1orf216 isoform 2-T3 [Menidia menidia]